jgi:hypothetical protein
MFSSTILVCQNHDWISNAKNQDDFPSYVSTFSINGIGKESCLVWEFKGQ